MSANTVYVKNISGQTSEKEIKDFFSFCGKITSIEVTPSEPTKSATVTFEKETAAKTALLLDNTQLGSTQVSVSSATGGDDFGHTTQAERDSDEITQEEKPRARIIAEYLAHGYVIGDQGIQKALDLDHKHGVSAKFLNTLQTLDQKYAIQQKAATTDSKYQVTQKAQNVASTVWGGLSSYYEKAAGTPTGQKFVNFYTQQQKQAIDIHNEAKRLAALKKEEASSHPTTVPGTEKTTSATGDASIVEDTKVAPLNPEKST